MNAASLSFAAYPAGSTATYRCQLEVLSDATSTYSVQSAFAACTSPQVQSIPPLLSAVNDLLLDTLHIVFLLAPASAVACSGPEALC